MSATTYPSIAAGSRITAGLLNSMLPLTVIKPADESVTSSVTLQNDNDLLASVVANAQYDVECMLNYEGGTQGASDLKAGFTVPSGATLKLCPAYVDTSGNFHIGNNLTGGTTISAGSNGAGVPRTLTMTGTLVVGSTAGTLQLQWAQNTSSGTPTIVHTGSSLTLTRTS